MSSELDTTGLLGSTALGPAGDPGATRLASHRSGVSPSSLALPLVGLGEGDEFVLGELLGEGGMGRVHAAHEPAIGRTVAVKRLREGAPDHLAWFLVEEARTLARLDHPNIVPVHALGQTPDGAPVVVMKRVLGERWSDRLDRQRDLDRDLELALEVTAALRFAHARGVLHRDVKPENVMVGAFGEVYLMDWGCACPLDGATTTDLVGTPDSLAPEMLQSGAVLGPETDIFLMGATLHRVVTGHARHAGTTVVEVLASAREAAPAVYAEDVPTELGELINRACHRDPTQRFRTVDQLEAALRRFVEHRRASELVAAGDGHLRALKQALETGATTGADPHFIAARSAYRAALDGWPDCAEAASGLVQATEAQLEHKLSVGAAGPARALIAELPAQAAARFESRLAQLEAQLAEAARERAERDVSRAARDRQRLAMIVGLIGLVMAGSIAALRGVDDVGPKDLAAFGVVGAVLLGVAIWAARRRLFVTRVSRTFVLGLYGAFVASVAVRLLALGDGPSVLATLRADLLINGLAYAIIGFSVEPLLALGAVPFVFGVAALVLAPEHAAIIPPLTYLPAAAVLTWVFTRRARLSDGAAADRRDSPG